MTRTLGCDISTTRIALADTDGRTVSIELAGHDRGAQRLAEAHRAIMTVVGQFVGRRQILAAFVERPGGRVHPSLWQMFGVTWAAIYSGLADRYRWPVSVWALPVSQWKQLTVGNGAATKAHVAEWCRSQGMYAANQDEYDAQAVARAGLVLLERGRGVGK